MSDAHQRDRMMQTSAAPACDAVLELVRICGRTDPSAPEISPAEAAKMRRCVTKIDNWLDRFMQSLPREAT